MMLVVIAVKGLSVSAYLLALSQHVGTLRFRWLVGCSESWFDCWCVVSLLMLGEKLKLKTHQTKLTSRTSRNSTEIAVDNISISKPGVAFVLCSVPQ